jgi:hypothetical protein
VRACTLPMTLVVNEAELVMWDEPNVELKCPTVRSPRYHKRCWSIQTAGRWPRKLESAKKCVTTYLQNGPALKIDDAEANDLYSAVGVASRRQRVGGRGGCCATQGVIPGETASSADLGCSSK